MMTVLRGGPLDGRDVDMPYSVNGLVEVPYVDEDGLGVAEYRIDGGYRRTIDYVTHDEQLRRDIDYIFAGCDGDLPPRTTHPHRPRTHHPACPGYADDCRCSSPSGDGDDEGRWETWEDWDDGIDVVGVIVIGFVVVGALYMLAQVARWAMRLG